LENEMRIAQMDIKQAQDSPSFRTAFYRAWLMIMSRFTGS
jgi:hypothetical protein